MNAATAAYRLLTKVGEPLHYYQITYRVLKDGLWDQARGGNTPWMSMNRTLNQDRRFWQVGPKGVYAVASKDATMLASIIGRDRYVQVRGALVGQWAFRSPAVARKLGIPKEPKPAHGITPPVTVTPGLACVIARWPELSECQRRSIVEIAVVSPQGKGGQSPIF